MEHTVRHKNLEHDLASSGDMMNILTVSKGRLQTLSQSFGENSQKDHRKTEVKSDLNNARKRHGVEVTACKIPHPESVSQRW